MKKNLLVSVVLVAALFVGLVSCSKQDDNLNVPVKKEQVKIFMSAPKGSTNLKSGSISEKKAITAGDTVDVQNILDVNILLSSEDESGLPINGTWSIFNIDNDRSLGGYDEFTIGGGGGGELGSMMSTKLMFFGLYQARFISKSGTEFPFFIRHTGMPGVTGDNWKFNYSFRLDKNVYQINNDQDYQGYTLYLKYQYGDLPIGDEYDKVNPSDPENFHALLFCGGENIFLSKGGFAYSAKEFKIVKCKYSPGYICFSFVSNFTPPIDGKYSINFYSGTFGDNWFSFKTVRESDWSKNDQIVFQTI